MVKRPKEGMDYMGGEVKKGWVSSVHSLSEANNNCKCREYTNHFKKCMF